MLTEITLWKSQEISMKRSDDPLEKKLEQLGDFGLKKLGMIEKNFAGKFKTIEIVSFILCIFALFTTELSFHQRLGIAAAACAIAVWRLIPIKGGGGQSEQGSEFVFLFWFLIMATVGFLWDDLEKFMGTILTSIFFAIAYLLFLSMSIQRFIRGDPKNRE
jgi:hypothetical protein